ncbi:hypothetical protein [Laribacter hongkongensis]|uniref:hypothetical protein n=1 Tax=Laribacter hongkongensis TaxID=168471 RepID=UPI001EFE2CA3|nr:hypothetical protein [Laribacter hongkongensis]MCG9032692.1 hypothetical protein [Laribacter hongkongensis]MCG9093284.1 hypothetical protein [Laribacter hongkongensis]
MARRLTLLALWFAGLLAALFSLLWGLLAALAGSPRALRIAVAQDQAANAALGGSEDETISSRQAFKWQQMARPETLTDIQRAARFYYLQQHAFGGKVQGQTCGAGDNQSANPMRLGVKLRCQNYR